MPITELQKQNRSKYLGSSDMAAVLNVDPYRSAVDVWMERSGKVPPFQGNHATLIGELCEDAVLRFAEAELGPIKRRNHKRVAAEFHMASHIDAILEKDNEPVEAKTTGILSGRRNDGFGEQYTDEVPPSYLVQCHVHMLTSESEVCHLAALEGGRGFRMYLIKRNEEIIDILKREAVKFWEYNLGRNIQPDGEASLSNLEHLARPPGTIAPLDAELVSAWNHAKEKMKQWDEKQKELRKSILLQMGECERGDAGTEGTVAMNWVRRTNFDAKRLQAENIALWNQYRKEVSYPVMRFKKLTKAEEKADRQAGVA